LALGVALSISAGAARASVFDTHGFGSRATALGGALAARDGSYAAVYYNPANLVLRRGSHIGVGFAVLAPELHVDRVTGAGDFDPLRPELNLGLWLGASTSIGGSFEHKLSFGVIFFHPLLRFTRVESLDPSTVHWYRYQSLSDKLVAAAAFGYELHAQVRVGFGAQILAELGGQVNAALSLNEQRFTYEDIDLELRGTAAPTLGLTLGPFYGVRFGVSYRAALELRYRLPVQVLLEEVGELTVTIDGTSLYTPHQWGFGLSFESGGTDQPGWSAELGLTYAAWSMAPPAGAEFRVALDQSVLRAEEAREGRETQYLIEVQETPVPLAARDTASLHLGLEWRPDEAWAIRSGYSFRPTPLPRPTGDGNALDTVAHLISLGGGFSFRDPTKILRYPLQIDVALQLTYLPDREATKASGAEPGGSYRFGGVIWNAMLDLRHDF
jgi:long-chain fatty acid transport protein